MKKKKCKQLLTIILAKTFLSYLPLRAPLEVYSQIMYCSYNAYIWMYMCAFNLGYVQKRGGWQCCNDACAPPCSRGDQILEVDSVSLRHAALSEAYAILSECGPGPVSLIISRHPNPKVRGCLSLFISFKIFNIHLALCKSPTICRTASTLEGLHSKFNVGTHTWMQACIPIPFIIYIFI